jgi:hypothetical protein
MSLAYKAGSAQGGTGPRIPDQGLVGRSGHQASKKKWIPPKIMINHDQTEIFTISRADMEFICVI